MKGYVVRKGNSTTPSSTKGSTLSPGVNGGAGIPQDQTPLTPRLSPSRSHPAHVYCELRPEAPGSRGSPRTMAHSAELHETMRCECKAPVNAVRR